MRDVSCRRVPLLPNGAVVGQGGSAALRRGPAPAGPCLGRPARRAGPARAARHLTHSAHPGARISVMTGLPVATRIGHTWTGDIGASPATY